MAEGRALREWVVREGATRTVEVGLGYGISATYICEGLFATGADDVCHVAIDPHQRSRFSDCGLQILADAGFSSVVELRREESQVVLPRFVSERRCFDLAFVDGDHRFDGVFLDLVYLGRLVRAGGVVIVDDYQLASVGRGVAFCDTNLRWQIEEVSRQDPEHNRAVLRTPRVRAERAWDDFVPF